MKTSDLKTIVDVLKTIEELIRAAPNGVPSGELYAHLMGQMSIETYTGLIDILVRAKRITKHNHLLKGVRQS